MLTKGAIGNLVKRYKAILTKCNLINTFGSLAVASLLVLGGAGVAEAAEHTFTLDTYDSDKRYGNQMVSGLSDGDSIKVTLNDLQSIPTASSAIRPGMKNGWTQSAELVVIGGSFAANINENTNNWGLYGGDFLAKDSGTYTIGNEADPTITTSVTLNDVMGNLDVYGSGSIKAVNSSYYAKSSKVVATNSVINGLEAPNGNAGRLYGAGLLFALGSTMTYDESSVEVTNVTGSRTNNEVAARVYGGGLVRGAENGSGASAGADTVLYTKQSSVTVNGENTKLEFAVGGSMISGDKDTNYAKIKADNTKVTVNAGYIEQVIGGHHVNYFGSGEITGKSEVVINGGTVDTVIGGNYLDFDADGYDGSSEEARTASVKNSVVTVNGGSVGTVIGGGYAYVGSGNNLSFVDNVTESSAIQIENATITGDVIGGGLADGVGTSIEVQDASIVISNSTFEGEDLLITTNSLSKNSGTAAGVTDAAVTLTNVDASAARLESNTGTIELRAEGEGTTSVGELSVGTGVQVSLTADGAANDAAGGDITKAISIGEGEYTATVTMEEGMYEGAKSGSIENGVATVTEATNSIMSNALDMASSQALSMNRILMNDVRKRLGDLRAAEGTHGAWMRYDGGKLSGSNGYGNDFTTFQLGFDTKPTADAPRFGVAFAYTHSDTDMKRGSAEMDAFSFALYGTKMYDNGMFFDVIGRVATADSDIVVDGDKKGSLDNMALSLSGEFGWRFDVAEKFYVEPQAELTYTYINSDDLTLSGGYAYHFDSVDSLVGRVGLATGFKLPNDRGDVYVRASAVHEFLGDAAVRGGSNVYKTDGEDTWLEYGIGANVKLTDSTYIWADVERTEGAEIDEEWRGTVGVRFSF